MIRLSKTLSAQQSNKYYPSVLSCYWLYSRPIFITSSINLEGDALCDYNYLTLGIRNGTLQLQYKAIKSQGINTVDSKCLTPVDVAYYALISCSTLHLICTLTRLQPLI